MALAADAPRPAVEETRCRIIAATRELYARKGSRGTTTREVADRAGVNEATLFRHFGTKGQLISAMLDHYSESSLPEMLERCRRMPTIETQLRELAALSIESMRRKEDLIKVSLAEEIVNPEGHNCAWRGPSIARVHLVEFFGEKVARGELAGDPEVLGRVFMSLGFSFVIARRIWADLDMDPEAAITEVVHLFLNGARAN